MFGSSLSPVVCRRVQVLFTLCSGRLYLQLFVGRLLSYLRYVRFVFISSCLQEGSYLIYVMFASSLSPVVCRRALVLFTLCSLRLYLQFWRRALVLFTLYSLRLYLQLFVGGLLSYLLYVRFVFISSCLQEGSYLIYVMFASSLPPVVCRSALVLFTLCSLRLYLQLCVGLLQSYLRYVRVVFTSSCLQDGSCLIYVMFASSLSPVVCRSALALFTLCSLRLYLQLFVGGLLSYLRYVRVVFTSSCLQERSCLIYVMFTSSLSPVVCRKAHVLFTLCSGRLYLQLFVGRLLSYLRYVRDVFISSCLQEGSCLIYVMFASLRLYLQSFVGGLLSYLLYVRFVFISSCLQDGSCLIYVMFISSFSPVVCRRAHVLFSLCSSRLYLQLFVGVLLSYLRYVRFVFISSCLQEASCLIYVMFGSSLPPVACRRAHVLLTLCSGRLYLQLFVGGFKSYLRYVRVVFTSSCLQDGSCLIYVMFASSLSPVVCRRAHILFTLCSLRLYLQLFVGGLLSYLRYVRFVFISSCLEEGSCLIYVMFASSLSPVVCRRALVLFTLCSLRLYLQLFVGGLISYLRYVRFVFTSSCLQERSCLIYVMFSSSLPPVVCRTALVLFTLCSGRLYLQLFVGRLLSYLRYVRVVFTSSCLQDGSCLIYVMFASSLSPVVCRSALALFTLCSLRLYLQLFVGGLLSYLRYVRVVFTSSCLQERSCLIYVMFTSSLSPVVCRKAHVLFTLCSGRLYLQLFVGGLLSYLRYVRDVFISSCLQEGSCLIYVMFASSLSPVVCRRALVLFTLCSGRLYLQLFVGGLLSYLRYVRIVFTSSCLQERSCLIYVMFASSLSPVICRRAHVLFTLCSLRLYLQLFVGCSCLIYVMFVSSLSPIVCRRALVLFTLCSGRLYLQLFVEGLQSYLRYVRVVFTSSCLQQRSCLIYSMFASSLSPVDCRRAHVLFTLCSLRLYLQLFVGGLMSYLRYVWVVFISSCLQERSCLIYVMFTSSLSPVVCWKAHVLFTLCSGRLYLQLFVGRSCLIYVMFTSSLSPVVCRTLLSYLRYVHFVFISSCLQEGSCLIYVMFGSSLHPVICRTALVLFSLCSLRLYLQLFIGGLISYLRYVRFVLISSCLQEGCCLIYFMFASSLSPVVCRRAHILFTLCSLRLYLQLFVGALLSYLRYVLFVFTSSCLQDCSSLIYVMFGSSLPPVVCRTALVLFTLCSLRLYLQLFVGVLLPYLRYVRFVFISSCLQEGSCLIYVMFGSCLPPVVCRSALVLFTLCSLRLYLRLFVGRLMSYLRYVRVVFTSSCLQDGSCLIYVMFGTSLSPVVCRRALVLFTLCSLRLYLQLFVGGLLSYLRYVRVVFTSSCLQKGSCLIYVMFASSLPPVVCRSALVLFTLCSLRLYLQLFVGGLMSYLRYVRFVFISSCLQGALVLFTLCSFRLYLQLFVGGLLSYLRYVRIVFTSSCLQERSCLIYVMFALSLSPVVCRRALVLFTLCSLRLYLQLFVGGLISYLRYVRFVFTSSCLQERSCFIYVMFSSSLPPVVCRTALVLFTLCSGRLYLQLFVGRLLSYLRYVRFVFISSCLQECSCLIYVMFASSLSPVVCRRALVLFTLCSGRLYLQLFVGALLSYLRYVHFVFISGCLQEGSCLIYVMFGSSLPPVVCRTALVLFTLCSGRLYLQLFVGGLLSYLRYVRFVFISSCLQEGSCLIYVMFGSSLPPVVCRRALVLFTLCSHRLYLQLFVGALLSYLRYVRFVFISSYLQEGSCLIYVMFASSLSPVVCRVLLSYLRYVRFVSISNCLQEGSCLIYVMFGSSLPPVVCRRALVLFTLCSGRLYLQLFVAALLSYLQYVRFVFISS